MTEKELFIEACFTSDLQNFYKNYILEKPSRLQEFVNSSFIKNQKINEDVLSTFILVKWKWQPSNICRFTGTHLIKYETGITYSYWGGIWYPCLNTQIKAQQKYEAYECQKIDCSCNDCLFLNRINIKKGKCIKLNKEVNIFPNTCQIENQECFVHRLDK
jgi:hypothetical protein